MRQLSAYRHRSPFNFDEHAMALMGFIKKQFIGIIP
jgi:hypothetical protein